MGALRGIKIDTLDGSSFMSDIYSGLFAFGGCVLIVFGLCFVVVSMISS